MQRHSPQAVESRFTPVAVRKIRIPRPFLGAGGGLRTPCRGGLRFAPLLGLFLAGALSLSAQEPSSSSSSAVSSTFSSTSAPDRSGSSAPSMKAPALVDPTGPDITLQGSEALFDVAVALNACGYDQGLAVSDPVRARIREEVNEALQQSAPARDAHDQVCTFIDQHRLADPGRDLAQYISLALYVTPPPDLKPIAQTDDMPIDATQVVDILPLLRNFSDLIGLHLIWVHYRPTYDRQLKHLHETLAAMVDDTNAYLKMPLDSDTGTRFLVVVEPMLDPAEINARVYGTDYVVVASPSGDAIRMNEVRHTYLHYEIEPLLYARESALDRLQPFLKVVRDAPLSYTYRSDVVSLVVECMIRAIEARTMDTGVAIYNIPADIRRSDLEAATREHNATVEAAQAVRRNAVQESMEQGYVLTAYFYQAFAAFERQPQSLKESIGTMVYGMDVGSELSLAKHVTFVDHSEDDVVRRSPQRLSGLDQAEADLAKGDYDAAGELARKSLDDGSGDAGRANFILARLAILHRDVPGAKHDFQETIRLSKDPRLIAWSHIYLGRIFDVENQRDAAVAEYQAALTARDGQPDTKRAAEKGLKQAYAVPQQAQTGDADQPPQTTQ